MRFEDYKILQIHPDQDIGTKVAMPTVSSSFECTHTERLPEKHELTWPEQYSLIVFRCPCLNLFGVPAAGFNYTGHDNKYHSVLVSSIDLGRQCDWQLSLKKPNCGTPSRVNQAFVVV